MRGTTRGSGRARVSRALCVTSEAPGGISNHNHVDSLIRGKQRTESDRPTTTTVRRAGSVSKGGEGEIEAGKGDRVFSLISRGQRQAGRESLLDAREEPRARLPSGARPTAFLPSNESSLHSSYRPLSLPPLCIAVPLSFATLTPLNLPHPLR